MTMRAPLALMLALSAWSPAARAETLMTADEFDRWSTGKTLDYAVDGVIYGSEQHFPGRRTLDANTGEPCNEGSWFPEGDAICFVYAAHEGTHCWHFWRDGDRVTARTVSSDPSAPAQVVTLSDTPLSCPGPEVGV